MEESTVNNFTIADVLRDLVSGATLHENDGGEGWYALLVWPDGRAKPADKYVCNAVDDSDFLDVVRSTREGLELRINDEGRRFLAEWEAKLAQREANEHGTDQYHKGH